MSRLKKGVFIIGLMVVSLFSSPLLWGEELVHWFEAEEFKGNVRVAKDAAASGGAYVEGRTWHFFAHGIPFPQDGRMYNVWVRASSDVPAAWYLMDREDRKAFGWFQTKEAEKWLWINIGRFSSATVKDEFYMIYLQRPLDRNIPAAVGRIDVVVITEIDEVEKLEELLRIRTEAKTIPAVEMCEEKFSFLIAARRVVDVPFIETSPLIDGRLDDDCWKEAGRLSDFILVGGKGLAQEQTIGYLLAGKDNLYLAAELMESQIPFLRRTRTIRGDDVWHDDCLDLFIDPGLTQRRFHQFIVNPLGTKQDSFADKLYEVAAARRVGLDWQVKTKIAEDRWVVEMAIPWPLLTPQPPQAGEIWGFNMCRSQKPRGELSH